MAIHIVDTRQFSDRRFLEGFFPLVDQMKMLQQDKPARSGRIETFDDYRYLNPLAGNIVGFNRIGSQSKLLFSWNQKKRQQIYIQQLLVNIYYHFGNFVRGGQLR